jgi:2-polyprenyl-6-methoxyphenol hydroxylase-like FAD-dependent oxidoreductase
MILGNQPGSFAHALAASERHRGRMNDNEPIRSVDCCIAGGGPAGVVLGLLLARQGVEVLLLEAHQNFDRDFRGDTVHPSTVQLLEQIGLLHKLLDLPHAAVLDFPFHFPDGSISPPPSERDRSRRAYSYQIPQHLLLDMLVHEARRYPTFRAEVGARVDGLLHDATGGICGLRYTAAGGSHEVHASLVIGADGRFSKVRQLAGMQLHSRGEPMDVLWFRLPKVAADPERAAGIYFGTDGLVVIMDRPDGWQVGYVFAKGAYQRLRAAGLADLHEAIVSRAAWLADRIGLLDDWRQTSLLSVDAGRVERWYAPGVLLIGDAAHVMTPVGGVGINYAVQDAVAAANVLGPRLLQGSLRVADLAAVQRRRELPTRLMQAMQRQMSPFTSDGRPKLQPALFPRLVMALPPVAELRRRLISFGGWRPGRVRDPASARRSDAPEVVSHLARRVWDVMCQVDPRAFAMFGMPVYSGDTPQRQPENHA